MRKSAEIHVNSRDRVGTRAMGMKIAEGESRVMRRLTEESTSNGKTYAEDFGQEDQPTSCLKGGLEAMREAGGPALEE